MSGPPDETPAAEIAASDPPPSGEPVVSDAAVVLSAPQEPPHAPSAPDEPSAQETAAPMPDDAEPAGEACRNCGATLTGPFCHECGQSRDDLHRSLPRLTMEVVGSLLDFDGRIWRTIPRLFFNPADLTRDYLNGERMSQTPPLRMFLIVVVMVFFAAAFADGGRNSVNVIGPAGAGVQIDAGINRQPTTASPAREANRAGDTRMPTAEELQRSGPFVAWLARAGERSLASPEAFSQALVEWSQRLAILLLPIGALTMGLMFAFSRRFVMFDHLIFTMHGLAAQGALLSVVLVVGRFAPAVGWLLWLSPVHTFAHMKGTYGLGVFSTLIRMLGLLIGAIVGSLLLAFAIFLITLYDVGGR